jgi:hypothetical protein
LGGPPLTKQKKEKIQIKKIKEKKTMMEQIKQEK